MNRADDFTPTHPPADFGAEYIPSPEEIADACKRIQATWSEREFSKRLANDRHRVRPVVAANVGDLTEWKDGP